MAPHPASVFTGPAYSTHRPLVDFEPDPAATLTARSILLQLEHGSADGWSAAMLLIKATRPLLLQGGLPVPQSVLEVTSTNETWRALTRAASRGEPMALVRLLRCLLQASFVDDTLALARRTLSGAPLRGDTVGWVSLVASMARSLAHDDRRSPDDVVGSVALEEAGGAILNFSAYLHFAAHAARHEGDARAFARHWIGKARDLAQRAEEIAGCAVGRALSAARLARRDAELFEASGDRMARAEAIDVALSELTADGRTEWEQHLLDEGTRRLLAFEVLACLRAEELARAGALAARLTSLDPTCPHAHLLAARAASAAGDIASEKAHCRAILVRGIIERPFALERLATLESRDTVRALAARERAAEDVVFARAPGAASSPPVTITASQSMLVADRERHLAAAMPRSDAYRRMLPYWELRLDSEAVSPRHALTPIVAFESFALGRDPTYAAITTQRGMVGDFRGELVRAIYAGAGIPEALSKLEALAGRSVRTDRLLEATRNARELDGWDRARLARVLGALGFFEAALDVAIVHEDASWSRADEYVACTRLFLLHVADRLDADEFAVVHRATFDRIRPVRENLRNRLVLSINALVYAAKRNKLRAVAQWAETTRALRDEVAGCSEMTSFERDILSSRAYRATAFSPFFEDDREGVFREIGLCEELARAAQPTTELERELATDNLYAALESIARSARYLGDEERVTRCYEELTRIDPSDAHAWLQRGDDAQRRGDLVTALDCFVRAERLAPPQGQIAAFRAARVLERLDRLDEALWFLLRATRLEPGGTSAYIRIRLLAERLGDVTLSSWSESAIATFADCGALSEAQLVQLREHETRRESRFGSTVLR